MNNKTQKLPKVNKGFKIKNVKKNWVFISIIIVFLIVLSLRLIISFQTTNMNKSSYYHLDQAKSILETGKPNMVNQLYDNSALPATDYMLAFFGIFINLELAAKILINLFMCLAIIIIYFIVFEITKDEKISLFAGIFTAFIPLIFKNYINNFNSIGISIIIFLLTLLFFIKSMNNTRFIRHFIITLIILIILTPLSAVFIAAFIIYFFILSAEKIKIRASEIEVFLFSLILGGWIYIILYKNAILTKGLSFLLHSPIANLITKTNFLFLSLIGIVPVILGIIGIYFNTIKKSNRQLIFITSFIIINIIFILFNIIDQEFSLIMISLGLIMSAGIALKEFKEFFNKSKNKIKILYKVLIIFIALLFIISSIIPSITNGLVNSYDILSAEDKIALEELKSNSDSEAIIMTDIEDTYLVNYFSDRNTILNYYNLNGKQKLKDVQQFFNLNINVPALRILTLYNVDYIFISSNTIQKMTNKTLQKFNDPCYGKIYKNKAEVYKVLCTLKQEEKLNQELFEDKNE